MFWSWHPLLYPGIPRSYSQPAGWAESLCCSLHSGELHSSWQVGFTSFSNKCLKVKRQIEDYSIFYLQHHLSYGTCQAVEKHVRQDQVGGHHRHDRRLCPHPVLGVLVEEERAGPDVCGDSVLCNDLVFHLIHSLRQRCLL